MGAIPIISATAPTACKSTAMVIGGAKRRGSVRLCQLPTHDARRMHQDQLFAADDGCMFRFCAEKETSAPSESACLAILRIWPPRLEFARPDDS